MHTCKSYWHIGITEHPAMIASLKKMIKLTNNKYCVSSYLQYVRYEYNEQSLDDTRNHWTATKEAHVNRDLGAWGIGKSIPY